MSRAYPSSSATPGVRSALALLAIALLAFALGGCGGEAEEEAVEPPIETEQRVPDLPAAWIIERNDAGGFALGVPPAWGARRRSTETELTSPDELAVVTVRPDRSDEALEADLEELADATAVELGKRFSDYELGETRRFGHRYDAFVATAKGTDKGVRQDIAIYLLRRDDLATFTVIAQRNPKFGSDRYEPTIKRIVRSIRSRPVG